MTGRIYPDWLDTYVNLRLPNTEAPAHVHFWCGVSAIAGALQRKVWIDQVNFQWFPNFYILIVAEPGIISKSTSADLAIDLLKASKTANIGPSDTTHQALFQLFTKYSEMIEFEGGELVKQSAMTILSSELGNLIDPDNKQQIDAYVTLFDGRREYEKVTKTAGNDSVQNAFLNLLACTTPQWMATSMPRVMIGGGLTSRIIWVVAEGKRQVIAYPSRVVMKNHDQTQMNLVMDLQTISTLKGAYKIADDAMDWGDRWYTDLYHGRLDNPLFAMDAGNTFARLQTQTHKLAMVLAASRRNELVITLEDLKNAIHYIEETARLAKPVFDKIGATDMSRFRDMILLRVQRAGRVEAIELYQQMGTLLPLKEDFDEIVNSLIAGEFMIRKQIGPKVYLISRDFLAQFGAGLKPATPS